MPICETCLHRAVCGKYTATGGVNKCDNHKEERHGRWITEYWKSGYIKGCTCSECGATPKDAYSPDNYCPNCGTPMDGGNEDE